MAKKATPPKISVEAITHEADKRMNIPTAEFEAVVREDQKSPLRVAYERRNRDLDPQLVWRGKDEQDWSDLVVHVPPLYIQEKIHPKALIDDLLRQSQAGNIKESYKTPLALFADFNGIPEGADKTDFYQHDQNWSNRMILGDSLQVMASLAEREGLRGRVQCIYLDPPYGIKFNSNFQWSTTSRDVKDGNAGHITREPEQVKAFRDTWRDGIHSYLTYLRDRLTVARDLLTESGSIFVQIGDENVHRVRAVMDEVFGETNYCSTIAFVKTTSQTSEMLPPVYDSIVWYSKSKSSAKYRSLTRPKPLAELVATTYKKLELQDGTIRNLTAEEIGNPEPLTVVGKIMCFGDMVSQSGSESTTQPFDWKGQVFRPRSGGWKTSSNGLNVLAKADRLGASSSTLLYKRYFSDYPFTAMDNLWQDTQLGGFLRNEQKVYVVQTGIEVVKRCLLMTTRADAFNFAPILLQTRVFPGFLRPSQRLGGLLSGSACHPIHS